MGDLTQVFIVTSGEYSSYGINSVWLTLEEAQKAAGSWGTVEVWPVGEHKATLGTFHCSVVLNATTGAVVEKFALERWPDVALGESATVLYWPKDDRLGIRAEAPTSERANKVYTETLGRVRAEMSAGLPASVIAKAIYKDGQWVRTRHRDHD